MDRPPSTEPTIVKLALFTQSPTDTGSVTNEVTAAGNAYARQTIAFASSAASGTISNTSDIDVYYDAWCDSNACWRFCRRNR